MQAELALYRAYPALAERLPRRSYLAGPTPIEPLAMEGLPEGGVFVKRDERSCPLYGGNKPRKLEFLVGEALARGSRRLVTTGALGTHHGLATAVLGRAAGLGSTLVLVRQPVTDEVGRSLRLCAAYGARLAYGGGIAGAALQALRVLAASASRGERPYLVPTGGSSPLGNLGFVSAAFELAEQVQAGAMPEPRQIFVPVGTGGTLAGLVAGLSMAGLDARVVGVLVTDILPPSPRSLLRDARRVADWLRRRDPNLPRLEIRRDRFELATGQIGDGYGAPTEASRQAVDAAARCGLRLENTYTGKCIAELRSRARRGALPREPVLFWNTYSAVDVEARAPQALEQVALPARLQRVLDSAGGPA